MIWPEIHPITKDEFNSHIKFIQTQMYGLLPVYDKELSKLRSYAKQHNLKLGFVLSVRNQLRIQKEIKSSHHINTQKITDAFRSTLLIPDLNLSNVKDFYAKLAYGPHAIIKVITQLDEFRALDSTYQKYFFQPIKDVTKTEHQSQILSADFERMVEDLIRSNNIPFLTEKEIRAQKLHTMTPDILFETPVKIISDGIPYEINWLDAKNFVFMGKFNPYFYQKLKKQADKYVDAFGPGAFVFRYGIVRDALIDRTLLLCWEFS